MMYYLFPLILFLLSCASEKAPLGGELDLIGPQLLKSNPNYNTNLKDKNNLTIFFDELVNPISVVNSIKIIPEINFQYKVIGKRIIITPNDDWPNSSVIKIKLSRNISDYQNNKMSSSQNLYFFKSGKIKNKVIKGYLTNTQNNLYELGLYKIEDNKYNLIEKTQSNENDMFRFEYINPGNYFIVAVKDSISEIKKDYRIRPYGMSTMQKIDLFNFDTISTNIRIDLPLEKLYIRSFDQQNNHYGIINYDNGLKENYLINSFQDTIKIVKKLKNRFEEYETNKYMAELIELKDSLPPVIESIVQIDDKINIFLNEPIKIRHDNKELLIYFLKDSLKNFINYKLKDAFRLEFEWHEDFETKIYINNLFDLSDNKADSLSSIINLKDKVSKIEGGSVYGRIKYDGISRITVEAVNLNTNEVYYTLANDSYEFSYNDLIPGFYQFNAFEYFGGYDSTLYFNGTWAPNRRAAKYGAYNSTIEIRKHWDIKDMIINVR